MSPEKFSGTFQECGRYYSRRYRREIAGFFTQEFGNYTYSKPYVRSCARILRSEAPMTAAFFAGVAKESLLSFEEHTLLLLHEEELYHRALMKKSPHCSAVGVITGHGKGANVLVGQNWDWSTAYYPWSTLNRFSIRGRPRIVALSYPGLPICAGVNSAGLTVMWTGAGYYPPVCPVAGVPTYALVFELMLRTSVASAVAYLKTIRNAGSFIFFIGDRKGKLVVVEGVPGAINFEEANAAHRANIFESAAIVKASRQKLPIFSKCHSLRRNKVFAERFPLILKRPSLRGVKTILSAPTILVEQGSHHATLMQLVADCQRGELEVRAWREKREQQSYAGWSTFKA
jgi:hypothetical protein